MTYFVSVGRNHVVCVVDLFFLPTPDLEKAAEPKLASSSKNYTPLTLDYKMDGNDINIEDNLFDLSRPN